MDTRFFFILTVSNFSKQEKNSYDLTIFFYFKFPTDRLGKIGSLLIRHSRNQPTVALQTGSESLKVDQLHPQKK